jgi:hypothetical protein
VAADLTAAVPPVAWLLNFEADRELATPGYTPSRAVTARTRELATRLGDLVRPGDRILDAADLQPLGGAYHGRAWCPTPRALTSLAQSKVLVSPAPPLNVLRSVNSRRFSAELGQTLVGAVYVDDEASLRAAVRRPLPDHARAWLLKSAWSTSGSGRREVVPPEDDDATWAWAARRLAAGIQVEPLVERLGDFALHGHLDRRGRLVVGEPCRQRVDAAGVWLESLRCSEQDLAMAERSQLRAEFERVAEALTAAGYFGPFNVDAFRYVGADGPRLNVRCEINARYTMGWATGLGDVRPDRPGEAES